MKNETKNLHPNFSPIESVTPSKIVLAGFSKIIDMHSEPETIDCHCCSDETPVDETITTFSGDEICEHCESNDYTLTANGELVPSDETVELADSGETVMECDALHCDHCGNSVADTYVVYQSADVCGDCRDDDFRYCVDVDCYVHEEQAYWCEEREEYFLEEPDSGNLFSYDFDIFRKLGKVAIVKGQQRNIGNNLVFGVELETDSRGGHCARSIADEIESDIDGWAICKEDSTVSGPEIVSLPACIDSHKLIGWNSLCETLRPIARGYHGSDNGMHIHVNLAAFSPLTLGKMLVFINDDKNRELLSLIAQRRFWENTYCDSKADRFDKVGAAGKNPMHSKFSPLNVCNTSSSKNTAEFRIFKSTLMPARIFKNIEFCHALVKYCEVHSVQNLKADSFKTFVSNNRKVYSNLSEFITARSDI